jgi:membrane-bound lytic murein transglycosylase D
MRQATRAFLLLFFFLLTYAPTDARAQTNASADNPFPLLPGLEKAVEFWQRIFTEYSRSQVVYEVVDLGEENRDKEFIKGLRERIAAAHRVDSERVRAQRGVKERMASGLQRSGRFIEQMQQIFRDRGLPVELTYLPLVESSFEVSARSHAGALGMWQFMRATGKQFLRVNHHIDERKDPLESTRAAASLLNQNYQTLGNWPLAITAYNYGAGGISRAVAEIGSDDLVELISRYDHRNWGFAAKNFYAEFIVAVDIAKNPDRYFPGLEHDPPIAMKEIEVKKGTSISQLAKNIGMTQNELLGWNPALSGRTRVVPAGYRLKVPVDSQMEPIFDVTQSRSSKQPQMVRHRVKRGETLFHIARLYSTSVDDIVEVNGLRRKSLIRAGTTLLIPKI